MTITFDGYDAEDIRAESVLQSVVMQLVRPISGMTDRAYEFGYRLKKLVQHYDEARTTHYFVAHYKKSDRNFTVALQHVDCPPLNFKVAEMVGKAVLEEVEARLYV